MPFSFYKQKVIPHTYQTHISHSCHQYTQKQTKGLELEQLLLDDWTMSNQGDGLTPEWNIPLEKDDQTAQGHTGLLNTNAPRQQEELQILDALFLAEPESTYESSEPLTYTVQPHQLVPPPAAYAHQSPSTFHQPYPKPTNNNNIVHSPQYAPQRPPFDNVFQWRNVTQQRQQTFEPTPTTELEIPFDDKEEIEPSSRKRKQVPMANVEDDSNSDTPLCFTRSGRAVKRNKFVNQQALKQENDTMDSPKDSPPYTEANSIESDEQREKDETVKSEVSEKIKSLKLYSSPTPKKSGLTSRFRGVCWYKRTNRWVVQIKVKGKRKHIGYFSNEEDAAEAYDNALEELIKTQQKELEDQAKNSSSKMRIPRKRIFNKLPKNI